jgi:gentisate 1,2-dioxygenase
MQGEGAETITDGKACIMEPGDLILTPAWAWHEHRHNGKGRVVWFDGLDYPLARQLGTVFFEMGPGSIPKHDIADFADEGLREGGVLPDSNDYALPYSPLYRYAWTRVAQAIDALPMWLSLKARAKAESERRLSPGNRMTCSLCHAGCGPSTRPRAVPRRCF